MRQNSKTPKQNSNLALLKKISLAVKKRDNKMQHLSGNDTTQTKIRKKEKKMEMSVYALLIIVTVALMLLIFNLLLMEG